MDSEEGHADDTKMATAATGDSGTGLYVDHLLHASSFALPCSAASLDVVGGVGRPLLIQRSLSSGFQSHSRNSSLESGPIGQDPLAFMPNM